MIVNGKASPLQRRVAAVLPAWMAITVLGLAPWLFLFFDHARRSSDVFQAANDADVVVQVAIGLAADVLDRPV